MSIAHERGFGPFTVDDLHAREDEGRGFELEDGWLIALSPRPRHNRAYRRLHEILEAAIEEAGASVYADRGGDWEIKTPAGIRKPDVFAAPADVVDACEDNDEYAIPGEELLLIVEVISPGSGSERTDRVRKLKEYAAVGIPQYWLVEYDPAPSVQVFVLDDETGAYQLDQVAKTGEILEVKVEADEPFTVRFDPAILRRVSPYDATR